MAGCDATSLPPGCLQVFRYQRDRGVYFYGDGLVWYSQTAEGEKRIGQSLEDFHKSGPPPGVISKNKLRRFGEILSHWQDSLIKQNKLEIEQSRAAAFIGLILAEADAQTPGNSLACQNCGTILESFTHECSVDPWIKPPDYPNLVSLSVQSDTSRDMKLMKCVECNAFFVESRVSGGATFTPTGQDMGTVVTLRRISRDEAIAGVKQGWL